MLGLSIRIIIRGLDHEELDMDRIEPPSIWWFFIMHKSGLGVNARL